MLAYLQQFVNSLKKSPLAPLLQRGRGVFSYLILANVLLVFFLIILTNFGILPFKRVEDFAFFAVIGLILALYRPGWAFLFFIGTIALESINIAPVNFPIAIRPYQFFGAITIIAVAIRLFSKRLSFKLLKLQWFDYLFLIFAVASFVSSLFAMNRGLAIKQSIILLSFIFLYFLVRNYIQTLEDLKKVIPFFLSSSIIVIFYGIWQNIAFIKGLNSFEIMPGRPNATFMEADWLGIFLVLLIAVIYSIIFFCHSERSEVELRNLKNILDPSASPAARERRDSLRMTGYYILLIPIYILLILTVSRSAWLGAGIVTIIFLKIVLTQASRHFRNWQWKEFLKQFGLIILTGIISLLCVYVFHLTNFQLFNRAQSSASGLQKITISCPSKSDFDLVPEKIENILQLENYKCRQINLEDIGKEKAAGNIVEEIYRQDPNVGIRSQIYQKSWNEIKKHPIVGIGWGNIGSILGTDERGASLNSSNIFLEVWLGSGIIGLLAFLTILGYIFIKSLRGLFSDDFERKLVGSFTILGFFGLLIPNMFNAGIFLGILWVFLGISALKN
jgi:hypothetical protein